MSCKGCKYLFCDYSVGYFECLKEDWFSDEQFDEYEQNGCLKDCPYYEKEEYK